MKVRNFITTVSTSLLLAAISSSAFATSISFSTSVGTQPGNVGTVTISSTVDANTVNVFVDLLDGYGFMNSGGPHTPFAFTLSGGETNVTAIFNNPPSGVYGAGTFSLSLVDGSNTPYGVYGISINSTAGNGSGNAYYGDLSFDVSRPGGLTVNDFVANSLGAYFSADLTDRKNTGAQAWFGGNPPTIEAPEPATLTLLGLGLIGLGASRRRIHFHT